MTDPNAALIEAVERFLPQAKVAVDEELNRDGPLPLTPEMLAESVAGLPAAREARAAAHQAATANNYLVTSLPRRRSRELTDTIEATTDASAADGPPEDETAEPNGRPLDADVLLSTGVFGLLQSRAPHDFHAVAEELAGYLAGPPIDIWDFAILDGNFTTDEPIQVIDGWELVTPTTEDLSGLLPLRATADYQPNCPFKPTDYAHLTMLRRILPDARPHHGPLLRFDVLGSVATDRRTYPLWRPLLLLSLFDNPVLQLWARYQVEPGRRIDKLFDDVEWGVWTLDEYTDIEQPRTGDFGEDADLPMLRRFLAEVSSLMPADVKVEPNKKKTHEQKEKESSAVRLRRCAEHFLTAGDRAHGEGEVLSELNAETVLHYVIALEGLLTGDESPTELTRKVSQRAAILAGKDDAQRRTSSAWLAAPTVPAPSTPTATPRRARSTCRSCAESSGVACLPGSSSGTRRQPARSARLQTKPCCPTRSWSAAYTSHLTSSRSVYGMSSIQPRRRMSQNSTGVPRSKQETHTQRRVVD